MSKNALCPDLYSTVTKAINDRVLIMNVVIGNLDINMVVYIIRQQV